MTKHLIKVTSFLLTIAILFSIIPMDVFAADELTDSFTIAFQKNGGSFYPDAIVPETFESGQSVVLPDETDITKPGYAFGGWFEAADFSGDSMTVIPADTAEDIVLYARWDELFYFITIPETVDAAAGTSTWLAGGGFYDGDRVDVSVSSQNEWQLKQNNSVLTYEMSETADGNALSNGDKILGYVKQDTSDRFSTKQNLYFNVTGAAQYSGVYSDTLTFTANFVGVHYSVTYNTGEGEGIEPQILRAGTKLNNLPVPAWNGHLFLVWCYDEALTKPVSDADIILGNVVLYAKYQSVQRPEETFSQTFARASDQSTDFCIPITASESMTPDAVKSLLTLKNISETKQTETLSVTGSGTSFTAAAVGGFKEGGNYKLNLTDDRLSFTGQDSSVDEYDFTIAKDEVFNLSLNEDISYLSIRDVSSLVVNGASASQLSLSVFSVGEGTTATKSGESTVGSFVYTKGALTVGSVIGVYEGSTVPDLESAGVNEEISFVEITSANGNRYNYRGAKAEDVLFTPDILPIPDNADTDGNSGNASVTVPESVFNYSATYYSNMELNAETTVDVNDYLAFYTGTMNEDGSGIILVSYAEIDEVTVIGENYTVKYHTVSQQTMMAAMDVYRKEGVDGDELLKGSDPELIERSVEEQAVKSGFVQNAAAYLSDLAMETDSFNEIIQEYGITADTQSNTMVTSSNVKAKAGSVKMQTLTAPAANSAGTNTGSTGTGTGAGAGTGAPSGPRVEFALTKAQVRIRTQLQHFEDVSGLRLTLDVGVQIIIHAASTFDIVINVDGSFEQEVSISLNIDGKAIWKVWGIFPYIADYTVSASVDLYEYTGINVEVSFQTQKADPQNPTQPGTVPSTPGASGVGGGSGVGDPYSALGKKVSGIGDEMKAIMEKGTVYVSDDADILQHLEDAGDVGSDYGESNVGKSIGEQYSEMLENNGDWVELYKQTLTDIHFRVILIIDIQFKIEFVVSANINITLGLDFWYENAKRYVYSLDVFAHKVTNDTIDLCEEKYQLSLYVMGTAGIRAGVRLTVAVGIFSTELACVGITAEVGAYFRIWGYFYYTLRYTASTGKTSNFSGAIYMELGIYLEIKFLASALGGSFSYNPTLYFNEWAILKIGEQKNVTDYSYSQDEAPEINMKRFITAKKLPDSIFTMDYLDMKKGLDEDGNYFSGVFSAADNYSIVITNPAFTFDPNTKTVTVDPGSKPEQDGEMIISWSGTWSSVSKTPLQRRIKLHWDNLRDGYYIAFEANGGSDTDMIVAKYGTPVTAPEVPTRQGYVFDGWYTDAECTHRYNMPSSMPNEDTLVYAEWTPGNVGYTVQHYKQSLAGNYELADTESLTAVCESTVSPDTKTYTGFASPEKQSVTITPDGGATVSYYYARNKYQITFNSDNGIEESVTNTYSYGADLTAPTFRSQGYDFIGWDSEIPLFVPANDSTFTANWAPSDKTVYSVRHYLQNANGDGYTLCEIEYLNGATDATVTAQRKSYNGFYPREALPTAQIKADGTTTLSVYYDRLFYSAVYHTNGGTECASISSRYGAAVTNQITTKQGYGFAGWYTDEALQNPFDGIMPIGGVELYAKWEAGSVGYTVRHYLQNTENDNYTLENTENFTAKADTSVSPEVKSYTGFTSPEKQTVSVRADGKLIVEYLYTRQSYTLTFVKANGEMDSVSSVRYGAAIIAPVPTRTGYTFAGWNTTVPETMPVGNCTYTAQWNINSYTISFNSAGGSTVAPITGTYGSAVTKPADPTRSGYTFTGWSAFVPATIPAGNITLTAGWSRDTYSIGYNLVSGTATGSNPISYNVESGMITVSNPTRTGYTFAGWTGTGLSAVTKSLTIPTGSTGNRSYIANWTENTYAIKYQIYGQGASGSIPSVNPKYTETKSLASSGFSRIGYTLVGWSTSAGGAKAYDLGQSVSRLTAVNGGIITLYPVWKANTYTVTYNGNGIAANQTATCTYDVNYTAPTMSANGYSLIGWAVSSDGAVIFNVGASFSNLASSGNYTLYAKWQVNTYFSHSLAGQTKNFGRGDESFKIRYYFGVDSDTTVSSQMVVNVSDVTYDALVDNGYQFVTVHITGHVKRTSGIMGIFVIMTGHRTIGGWSDKMLDNQVSNNKAFDISIKLPIWMVDAYCVMFESGAGPTHVNLTNYKVEYTFTKN